MKGIATVGSHRHLVTLQNPGPNVADGDGGYTNTWTDLSPATWPCSIEPATARDLERVTAGTAIATSSHILRGRYHSGITTQTRIQFNGRTFYVLGVSNPEERNVETIVIASEVVA